MARGRKRTDPMLALIEKNDDIMGRTDDLKSYNYKRFPASLKKEAMMIAAEYDLTFKDMINISLINLIDDVKNIG